MATVKFSPSHAGIDALMKSPRMQRVIDRKTQAIAAAAGPGYEPSSVVGRNRIHGSVITGTYAARVDNARRQTLLKALGAGRA